MKLKNISGRSQFMRTHKPQPDENIRIALENQLKTQAEKDETLRKYVKTIIPPIEDTHLELNEALQKASKSEFAQTIDTINQFISTINHNTQFNDNNEVSLFLPIENTTPLLLS